MRKFKESKVETNPPKLFIYCLNEPQSNKFI